VADVVDHPLGDEELGQLGQAPVENGKSWSTGRDKASFLIATRCGSVKVGGRPPAYRGTRESNPSVLKLLITSRTRSGLVNATLVIAATSIRCAESNTICARLHVTTDPDERRTVRNNRLPSSDVNSRTRNPSRATGSSSSRATRPSLRDGITEMGDLQGQRCLPRQ
jgi:hypothetical protein